MNTIYAYSIRIGEIVTPVSYTHLDVYKRQTRRERKIVLLLHSRCHWMKNHKHIFNLQDSERNSRNIMTKSFPSPSQYANNVVNCNEGGNVWVSEQLSFGHGTYLTSKLYSVPHNLLHSSNFLFRTHKIFTIERSCQESSCSSCNDVSANFFSRLFSNLENTVFYKRRSVG